MRYFQILMREQCGGIDWEKSADVNRQVDSQQKQRRVVHLYWYQRKAVVYKCIFMYIHMRMSEWVVMITCVLTSSNITSARMDMVKTACERLLSLFIDVCATRRLRLPAKRTYVCRVNLKENIKCRLLYFKLTSRTKTCIGVPGKLHQDSPPATHLRLAQQRHAVHPRGVVGSS